YIHNSHVALPSFFEENSSDIAFVEQCLRRTERYSMDYRISLVGFLNGFLVGLTGTGGGALLAPLLLLFFQVPPVWAVGTDMAYATVTKAAGSFVHIRQKHVSFRVVLWLASGSLPAIFLSVGLVQFLRQHAAHLVNGVIVHAIGYTLLLVGVLL